MIPLGVLASAHVQGTASPPYVEPIDLTGNFTPLQVTTSLTGNILTCTTTTAATASTLPRLQRITTPLATAVTPGMFVTLAAEVKHSRALPISIACYPLSDSGAALTPRPRGAGGAGIDWTAISVEVTIPATAVWLGWQVIVDSSTAAGPSQIGDVWEVRDFRAIISA